MQQLRDLLALANLAGRAIMPIGIARAFEARRVFRNRGLGRVSLRAAVKAWLAGVHLVPADLDLRDALVIDIGANEGKFSEAVLAIAPEARIVAIEPGVGPRRRLGARLGAYPNVEILDVAVSSRAGTATFHVTAHDHNSSLRPPLPQSRETIDDGWEVVDTVQVPIVSLDELVGERDVDLLKIDVQGGEMDVIRGGERTLERTRAVLLEMNFFSQYEQDATFSALNAEMEQRGFALVNLATPVKTTDGTPLFADACYTRPRCSRTVSPSNRAGSR